MRLTIENPDAEIDLDAVDLFDPNLYAHGDPHAIWKVMRERDPVRRQLLPDGRSFWSVTKYRDVNDVLRDHTRFTSARGTLLSILGTDDPAGGKMMAATDPPDHTAMRKPLDKVLCHRALRSRDAQIRGIVHRMLSPLLLEEPWDVAAAGANFPMAFTGTLMGLPEEDWPRLTKCTTMAIANADPEFREGSPHATLIGAHHELFDYFSDLVADRGSDPGEDLVGYLMTMSRGDDRKMRLDEIVYNCYSLLLGANVTTPHAIAATVQAFAEHPDQYERVLADPTAVTSAVEEGLRWASPANHFMRHTVGEEVIQGVRIPAGQAVVAWLGSANRDEDAFPDPFRFDAMRTPNRHVAFGFGPHFCIGAPLARIALRLLFEEITRMVAAFELAGPPEHLCSNFVAGLKHLPVVARLRPGAAEVLSAAGAEPVFG